MNETWETFTEGDMWGGVTLVAVRAREGNSPSRFVCLAQQDDAERIVREHNEAALSGQPRAGGEEAER